MNVEKNSFVTIFLAAQNVHCYKDVGMIPQTMSKNYGYKSYVVCRGEGKYDTFSDLKLIKLGNNHALAEIKLVIFICKNARKIKILNLYHWGRHTYFMGFIYKLMNRKGKLYVKCDIDDRGLSVIQKNDRAKSVFSKIVKLADLTSCESKKIANQLNMLIGSEVVWIPNGLFQAHNSLKIEKKEKIILTVGRLGTEQKATENLVEAFKIISNKIPDWKLYLAGSMTPEFEIYITKIKGDININDRIITTGEIENKTELDSLYSKSAIFVLPSRWESFALVMLEALGKGCYFIGTEGIAPIRDVIINDKIGKIVANDKIDELALTILETVENSEYFSEELELQRIQYVNEKFDWSVICKKIIHMLNEE